MIDLTIKDIAEAANISTTAVYKRIKAKGLNINDLRNKDDGKLTTEGEEKLSELFNLHKPVNKVDNMVYEAEIKSLKKQIEILTDEISFLRLSLERSQQLQAATLTNIKKLPSEPWFKRIFSRKGGGE